MVAFGTEQDGTPIASADVVAHEVMHGVTHFSVASRTGSGLLDTHRYVRGPSSFIHNGRTFRCGRVTYGGDPILCDDGRFLLFANHGGAIDEAYSDIIGTAVEFFSTRTGRRSESCRLRNVRRYRPAVEVAGEPSF